MLKGFTAVELVVTTALVSIVSLFAIPSISKTIESNKISSDVQKVLSIISTARSKAISQHSEFTICGDELPKKCSRNWRKLKVLTSDKKLVHKARLTSNLSSVNWFAFQNKPGLTIAATGFTSHQNGTLYLCHSTHKDLSRAIVISKSGRASVKKSSSSIDEKCNN